MSAVGLVLDPRFERHQTGPGHPERPARIVSLRRALENSGLASRCRIVEPIPATDAMLERVHDPAYLRHVAAACERGERVLDSMDTAICAESEAIAREAAGAVVALGKEVARGRLARGFAAIRPPGHHAERDLAMGFCLFNNVAVAARTLQEEEGAGRVLIVDWDVHHGNGTQHVFEEDPSVFYFSLHQHPLYPGTGAADETGRGDGAGTTLNRPLRPGAGDAEFLAALSDHLVPAADAFRPDFVLVSAGFDAHAADPLAALDVSTSAYVEATRIVRGIAERHAGGRLVSVLEGGYDLDALGDAVTAHVRELLEEAAA